MENEPRAITVRTVVTAMTIVFMASSISSAQRLNNEIDYTNKSLGIGLGYDAVSGAAKGECMKFTSVEPFSGLETLFMITQVESTQTLNQQMNVSAEAGLKFLIGSGSLKVKFAQDLSVTSYSTFVLVKTVIRAPVMNAKGMSYADGFSKLLKASDGQKLFRRSCGDFFISGYISGGEFYGIIQIDSTDQDSKQSLEGELKFSYGIFGSSAEFQQKLQTIVKNRQVTARAYQGGGVPKVLTVSPDGLMSLATQFPTAFVNDKGEYNGKGVVYSLLIQPYDNLPPPEGANVSPLVAKNQIDVLDRLSLFSVAFNQQINDLNYIAAYPDRFVSPDPKSLGEVRNKIIEMNNKVIARAKTCFDDTMTCSDDPSIAFVKVDLPKMKGANSCKNPVYNLKTDPKCGIVFKEGTGSECGQLCTTKPDSRCGVAHWNSGSSSVCAPIYREAADSACPVDHVETSFPGGGLIPVFTVVYKSCRVPAHGLERYETCENPAFGVKEYASCQVCDGFRTCRHPDFGIEQILSCRLPEFGLEGCADLPPAPAADKK